MWRDPTMDWKCSSRITSSMDATSRTGLDTLIYFEYFLQAATPLAHACSFAEIQSPRRIDIASSQPGDLKIGAVYTSTCIAPPSNTDDSACRLAIGVCRMPQRCEDLVLHLQRASRCVRTSANFQKLNCQKTAPPRQRAGREAKPWLQGHAPKSRLKP